MTNPILRIILTVMVGVVGITQMAAQLPRVGSVIDANERRYFGVRSRGATPDWYRVERRDSLTLYGYLATDSLTAVDTVRFSPRQTDLVQRYLEQYEVLALADTPWYRVDTGYVRMAQNLSIALPYTSEPSTIGLATGDKVIAGTVVARSTAGILLSSIGVDSTIRQIRQRPYTLVGMEDVDSVTMIRDGRAVGWIPTGGRADRTNGLLTDMGVESIFSTAMPPEVAADLGSLSTSFSTEDVSVADVIGRDRSWRLDAAVGLATAFQRPVVRLDIVSRTQEPASISSAFSESETMQYMVQSSLMMPLSELFDVGFGGMAVFEESTTADSADVGHVGFDSYQGDVRFMVHLGRVDRYGYQPLGLTAGVRVGAALTSVRWWTSYNAHPMTGPYWDSAEYQFLQLAAGADLRVWWWPTRRLGMFVGGQIDGRFGGEAEPESITYIDRGQFVTVTRVLESTTNVTAVVSVGVAVNL